jgi:branched-chain amino acid aminotransferase
MQESKTIWHNGKMVPWGDAKVHVLAHCVHYGSSVFEGIRAYNTPDGSRVFRMKAHIRRLYDSAKIYGIKCLFTSAEITQACFDILDENEFTSAYIRPLIYLGYGELGLCPTERTPVEASVVAIRWGTYLGEDALDKGVDVCISSWTRLAPNTMPTGAKAGGNYLSSQLIAREARRLGFVEAIALDNRGLVSEGPGENVFVIRDGVITTPPLTASILPGITRDTVITIARDLGYDVRESDMSREMLYVADEIFFTGTAAEITPVRSVDAIQVGDGKRGPMTQAIQEAFFGLFNGQTCDKWGWLEGNPRKR